MTSSKESQESRGLAQWETRAHAVVNTAGRRFVYQWTAPRSPMVRLGLVPLFVVAALFVLVLFVFLFALALTAGVLALVAARLGLLRPRSRSS